ncbi:MAG: hypothetical protein P0S94_00295, partial [Simkaniaceae bacterium]|nr:hypothetical protein [Simkaniaceae bacterium]
MTQQLQPINTILEWYNSPQNHEIELQEHALKTILDQNLYLYHPISGIPDKPYIERNIAIIKECVFYVFSTIAEFFGCNPFGAYAIRAKMIEVLDSKNIYTEQQINDGYKALAKACGQPYTSNEEIIAYLKNHREIEDLDLSGQGISYLPVEIGLLKNLKGLNLANNDLAYVPTIITQLPKLEDLRLNNNALQVVHHRIGNLSNLKILDIGYNTDLIVNFIYPEDNDKETRFSSIASLANCRKLEEFYV